MKWKAIEERCENWREEFDKDFKVCFQNKKYSPIQSTEAGTFFSFGCNSCFNHLFVSQEKCKTTSYGNYRTIITIGFNALSSFGFFIFTQVLKTPERNNTEHSYVKRQEKIGIISFRGLQFDPMVHGPSTLIQDRSLETRLRLGNLDNQPKS